MLFGQKCAAKKNPHPHVCRIRHGRGFFLRRISASKIIASKWFELLRIVPSLRYKNPYPYVCRIRHGREFFLRHISARKSLRQYGSNSCGFFQAHDTKIRTLTYVEYATVAGGSAAAIEGALPLTAICFANCAYPREPYVLKWFELLWLSQVHDIKTPPVPPPIFTFLAMGRELWITVFLQKL